jgi:hypothetical protein
LFWSVPFSFGRTTPTLIYEHFIFYITLVILDLPPPTRTPNGSTARSQTGPPPRSATQVRHSSPPLKSTTQVRHSSPPLQSHPLRTILRFHVQTLFCDFRRNPQKPFSRNRRSHGSNSSAQGGIGLVLQSAALSESISTGVPVYRDREVCGAAELLNWDVVPAKLQPPRAFFFFDSRLELTPTILMNLGKWRASGSGRVRSQADWSIRFRHPDRTSRLPF